MATIEQIKELMIIELVNNGCQGIDCDDCSAYEKKELCDALRHLIN